MEDQLTPNERALLLQIARTAIQDAVSGEGSAPLNLDALPERLREQGATFVTLTRQGKLRGCIGTLELVLPLAEDVQEHAVAAAMQDYRFPSVQLDELVDINIEISRLTKPKELAYTSSQDLLTQIRPNIDGVVIRDGIRRATFLPQVWEKIPDPVAFMNHLCQKLGAKPDHWRNKTLRVFTYQVEEFHE